MHTRNFKAKRKSIKMRMNTADSVRYFLQRLDIDVTQRDFFKVRADEKSPSCKINQNGSCYDFGSGDYYSDIVSLLYDGYHAFNSLPETMAWVCDELGIDREAYDE